MNARGNGSDDWKVGVRVWLERAGQGILGEGRFELLEGIERWASISAAARHMKMSYRHAWLQIQDINQSAGQPLVIAATGGKQGGGARLTPLGQRAIAVYREVQQHLKDRADDLLPALPQVAATACLHVAAAVSLEEVLAQLLADFAGQHPGVRVRTVFGASNELADHLLAGTHADVFLTASSSQLERLEEARLVYPGSRRPLASNRLAAIAPLDRAIAGHRPADLAEVKRLALAEPSCPLGGYARTYLEKLGLYEVLLPRAVLVDSSRAVLAVVRAGQVDAGLVYSSDAVQAAGCQVLFKARQGQPAIRYEAARIRRSRQPAAGQAFLDFVTSRRAARLFRRCGFTV